MEFFFLMAIVNRPEYMPLPTPLQPQTICYFDKSVIVATELPDRILTNYDIQHPMGYEHGIGYWSPYLWLWKAVPKDDSWQIERFEHYVGASPRIPIRWRIQHGQYWASASEESFTWFWRIPLRNDLARFKFQQRAETVDEHYRRQCDLAIPVQWGKNPSGEVVWSYLLENEWKESRGPLGWNVGFLRNPPLPRYAHGAMLPLSANEIWMFLHLKDKLYVWPGKLAVDGERQHIVYAAKPAITVRVELRDGFTVYGDRKAMFFVTYGGQVVRWANPGKENQKFSEFWPDKDRPIHTVIGDASSTRAWVFTNRGQGKGKGKGAVYFELSGERAAPSPYTLKPLGPESKLPAPLRKVIPYYEVLKDARKIAPENPPKREPPATGRTIGSEQANPTRILSRSAKTWHSDSTQFGVRRIVSLGSDRYRPIQR